MLGVRDLFRIGIGPSRRTPSGRCGPRTRSPAPCGVRPSPASAATAGSLAWTGTGHATDTAVVLGLAGFLPDAIEPEQIDRVVEQARNDRSLIVAGRAIAFDPETDIVFDRDSERPSIQYAALLRVRCRRGGGGQRTLVVRSAVASSFPRDGRRRDAGRGRGAAAISRSGAPRNSSPSAAAMVSALQR